jgi:hypothetical protein
VRSLVSTNAPLTYCVCPLLLPRTLPADNVDLIIKSRGEEKAPPVYYEYNQGWGPSTPNFTYVNKMRPANFSRWVNVSLWLCCASVSSLGLSCLCSIAKATHLNTQLVALCNQRSYGMRGLHSLPSTALRVCKEA